MRRILKNYGPWALLTGASSGIGLSFAHQLAALGFNLVIVARRIERLEALAQELRQKHAVEVRVVALDLSTEDFLPVLEAATQDIEIGLLVNNAGFTIVNPCLENELQREIEQLHVNNRAPLMLTHTFGRRMKQRQRGGVIFVSSVASFIPSPPWSNYVATKAYQRYLGECLAESLAADGIDVLVLCPGGTETEFQQVGGADSHHSGILLRLVVTELSPDVVAHAGLKHLGRRRVAIVGWRNRLFAFLFSLLPRRLAIHLTYQVMKDFKCKSD